MKAKFKQFRDFIFALGGFIGVIYIPADLFGLTNTYPGLKTVASMIDRFTVLAIFSGLLVFYILWIDLRPYLQERKARNRLLWAMGKTRFEIWEAACFIEEIELTDYHTSSEAQAIANEMLYYVKEGLVSLAGEQSYMKKRAIDREERPSINTALDRKTVDQWKDGSIRSWLPTIDKINRQNRGS